MLHQYQWQQLVAQQMSNSHLAKKMLRFTKHTSNSACLLNSLFIWIPIDANDTGCNRRWQFMQANLTRNLLLLLFQFGVCELYGNGEICMMLGKVKMCLHVRLQRD